MRMHRPRRIWQVVVILGLVMACLSACAPGPTATPVPLRATSQPQSGASSPPAPPTVAIPLPTPTIERLGADSASYPLPTVRPRTPGVYPLPEDAKSYPPPVRAPQSPEAEKRPTSVSDAYPEPKSAAPAPEQKQVLVQVDTLQVRVLESLSIQVQVTIQGNLPNGCARIKEIAQSPEGKRIFLSVIATQDPSAICTQALVPFEETITLDISNLEPGSYSVEAHGATVPLTLSAEMVATPEPTAACSPTEPDLVAFSDPDERYCFIYPRGFAITEPEADILVLSGPSASSQGPGPITISLKIRDLGPAQGVPVSDLAETHLAELSGGVVLARALSSLGGQPALIVDGLPGERRSRRIYVVQGDMALELTLYPIDADATVASGEAEALWEIVRRSFIFLSPG